MTRNHQTLVVVGHGAAGLAAALSAAEQADRSGVRIDISLLEKSREAEAGGNTRWSPCYMRLDAPDRLGCGFEDDMQQASGGLADRNYFRALADNATATIGWLQTHGVEFTIPVYYLSAGPARIQPVGGGKAIVEKLADAARSAGVKFLYETAMNGLVMADGHRVRGMETQSGDGVTTTLDADAIILASGGFQGNSAMMRAQFGLGAETLKLISPGTGFDTGDGIRMAMYQGARVSGDWNGMHIEPVDPRAKNSAPVVLVYPYGIVVDQDGRRFFDEVLEDLAAQIKVPAGNLRETVDTFNAAATLGVARFDATRCDGLAAADTLNPPKSNWARAITQPPYLAYPLVGAVAYTFGGLATNERAEVLSEHGPMPGLYAAGETTGHFYRTAPNAVSVLRALVFGRMAGREAVSFLQTR